MTTLTAKPLTAKPLTARPLTAYRLGESTDSLRWYLHWGGVNEYAVHSAWAMSGFGDKIEFKFIADTPGTGDDYLFDSTSGENYLKITNTTAALSLGYMDIDGATQRTIAGPTIVAGTEYTGYVEFKADGVDLVVNGTTYDSANVPEIKDDFTHIAAEATPSAWFDGTILYLRYVNATALQGVNAVQGNGVDLYGVIPEITLTGDFEIEFWWKRQNSANVLTRLLTDLTANNVIYAYDTDYAGGSQLAVVANGVATGFGSGLVGVALGQDVHIRFIRASGLISCYVDNVQKNSAISNTNTLTLSAIGTNSNFTLGANSTIQNLKITDKSGAEDVVYEYDLSGDDGSDIPITIDGVASTPGTWQNYDSGTDQVALPVLSRNYRMKDGPDALFLEDANHPLGPELVANPGPFVDTTGYTAVVATLSVVDSALRVTKTHTNGQGRTTAPIVSGKTYLATAKLKAKTTASTTYFQGGTSAAGTQYFNKKIVAGETGTAFFTATGTTLYINLYSALTAGEYEDWEFVSVKCIETGAILYNISAEDWSRSKS